jgi:mevalonate kinase
VTEGKRKVTSKHVTQCIIGGKESGGGGGGCCFLINVVFSKYCRSY